MPAKYNFTGKVALVTGSSSGIGAAIAIHLSRYGARVTITGRDARKLAAVADKVKTVSTSRKEALQVVGDFGDPSFARSLFTQALQHFGRLDFLINNAGRASANDDLSNDRLMVMYDDIMKLNVRSVLELTQLALPELEKSKGNIVNISSIASLSPFSLVYSTSKAALDMITKACAKELGPKGIRVNSINPGPVVSDFWRAYNITEADQLKQMCDGYAARMPLHRVGQPQDVANLVCFLVSDDASNMTGSIILNDSGSMVRADA